MLNLLWVLGAVIDILRGVTICLYSVHICQLYYR